MPVNVYSDLDRAVPHLIPDIGERSTTLDQHPGVIFLLPSVPRAQQVELFSAALDVLEDITDLVNAAVEVGYVGDLQVADYTLP